MTQVYQQVSGGACSLTMYAESSPGQVAAGTKGVRLAFMSESFSRGSSKKQRSVITGKRGAGKPYEGLPQMSGGVEAAAYAPQLGYILRALCGSPATSDDVARTLEAAAVAELGVGLVGLPCPGHGFVQDAVITVYGTQHYDGQYRVERGVTENVIAVAAPFVAETLPSDAKAYRGRAPVLQGAAQDLGGGVVALPVRGVHSLNAGESVRVEGTTGYDGTYVLQPGTADNALRVLATFAEETFDGTAIAVPKFYRHAFALPKRQPTVCMEKYLDFEAGAATNRYQQFGFCKVNGFNFSFGGDDELKFTLDFAVGRQTDSPAPIDAAPLEPAAIPLDNIESALWIGGARRGDVQSGSCSNAFGIEAKAAAGDLGQYSRMPEGDPECSATLSAFLEQDEYLELARARSTVPFALSLCSASGDEAWFRYPETELDVPGTSITGKAGLMQDVTVMAFVDKGATVLTVELINRVASYAF